MAMNEEGVVQIEIGGTPFKGEWKVEREMLTVYYQNAERTMPLAAEPLPTSEQAKEILSDLVGAALSKGQAS